jgi:uncharacterized phosphosugar-binding protein
MLKMFSTQVSGLFNRIQEQNEFQLEDGARLLAQAAIGNGTIFVYGFNEMAAISAEAVLGAEPLAFIKKWTCMDDVLDMDRVIIFSRFSNDPDTVVLAKDLANRGIPFVAVSTAVNGDGAEDVADLADVHIDLLLSKGLLPDDGGNRVGYPGAMAGLFVYHALRFTLDEILADFE